MNESDLKSLIEMVMNENENFNLSPEGKLEFLITSLKDLVNESESESNGHLTYYMNRIARLINMVDKSYQNESVNESKKQSKFDKVMHEFGSGTLKTPSGDKVTNQKQAVAIAYSESGLDEESLNESTQILGNFNVTKVTGGVLLSVESGRGKQTVAIPSSQMDELFDLIKQTDSEISESILNERIPVGNYDEWANIETGGAHGRGVQNRKNLTRKENSKEEQVSSLNTPGDYRRLILQWGKGSDENAEQIFNSLVKKYKKGIFTISDLSQISQFGPIEGRRVTQLLSDFVDKEGYNTGYYSDKNPSPQSQAQLVQQPR